MFAARVIADRSRTPEPYDCDAPSTVHSRRRTRPDTRKILEGRMVMASSTQQPPRLLQPGTTKADLA